MCKMSRNFFTASVENNLTMSNNQPILLVEDDGGLRTQLTWALDGFDVDSTPVISTEEEDTHTALLDV